MANAIEYVGRLADTIGARPAGTEEEQQASFMIEEALRDEAELPTDTEEFNCNLSYELPRTICCAATAVLGILTIFLPLMVVPSVVITLITAALYILDVFEKSPLARFGNSGISQNILAKYTPQTDGATRGRKRKVVIMAHYDTGKVRTEAKGGMLNILPYIYIAEVAGMGLMPIVLLIRFVTNASAGLLTTLNVLVIICAVICLLPVIGFLMHQTAQYNKGANVNASGIAVLLECAKRISEEPEELEADIIMHGEDEIRARGLVPEGAELTYEETANADGTVTDEALFTAEALTPEEAQLREQAAQGANAGAADALANGSVLTQEDQLANAAGMQAASQEQRAAYSAAVSQGIPAEPEPEEDPNVPEWYRNAMKKANKQDDAEAPVHRSQFADALDNANAVSANAIEHEEQQSEAERRLAQMRASIMGQAGAPGVATANAHAHAGVGGYLQTATEASNYEEQATIPVKGPDPASLAGAAGAAVAGAAGAVVPAASGIPVSQAEADAAAAEAAAAAAAAANKTLSFIPVEVDTAAIAKENAELKAGRGADGASAGTSSQADALSGSASGKGSRKKRTIALPSLTGAIEGVNARLQNAPLSDEEEQSEEAVAERRHKRQEKLAGALPKTDSQELPAADKTQAINAAGAFVSASATSTFNPVGDELIADVAEEDVYIEDADDSAYGDSFTRSGAPAGPGYVEMPKSRASKMFGRFRKKKKEDDVSISEAYGLDEEWDARSAGAARGGWESFREDSADDFIDDEEWNGGAFSRVRQMVSAAPDEGEELDADYMEETGYDESDYDDAADAGAGGAGEGRRSRGRSARGARAEGGERASRSGRSARSSRGGSQEAEERSTRSHRRSEDPFANVPLSGSIPLEERELIQQFRNGAISCEVWFLAVGAELANNAGVKSFLDAHADELRGSIVIDLDGLGAGELSLIEEDGIFKVKKPSARMKRYTNKAASALGLKLGRGKMRWRNSGAHCTASRGLQTLHVAGMQDGKPAFAAQADDVIGNISEEILDENVAFVMEVLRQI